MSSLSRDHDTHYYAITETLATILALYTVDPTVGRQFLGTNAEVCLFTILANIYIN